MFATSGQDGFLTCDNSMDANGAEHDSLGRFTGLQKKDLQRSGNNGKVKVSPRGKNKMIVRGFVNAEAERHHWGGGKEHDHKGEYAGELDTFEEYKERALWLLEQECTAGGIRGFKTKMGDIVRYNPKTNDFAVGHPLIGIRSMFKPRSGAAYFENEFKRKGE